ncbi:MAG TPA: regulatory iron-sulfur-containing complex subunit RicT [Gemmatimonadaceae bacterium]|nr:regulatory iron-sulfur-containing complex subunit RicT [Gemmatimonadaceae bacterium]
MDANTHLIEVAFKGNRKEFYLWTGEAAPAVSAPLVVEADRGEDLGRVHAVGDLAQLRARGCTHGIGDTEPTQRALRLASPADVRRLTDLRTQDETARRDATALVRSHSLQMKLTDAEWRWDRRKLTIYFVAERRVDFRNLVRDLAAKFRTRIELKQIGVRDEARRLDGVGRCGRRYCSASWLPDLRPVSLGLAKDQKLSLNPTQISGACGRLMCCLRHEHDWYVETRRLFPKEGKVVSTSRGEEKVILNDLFRERVTLRGGTDGELRVIPLEQLNRELRGEPIETDAPTDVLPPEAWSEELLSMTDTVERPVPAALRAPRPLEKRERPVQIARAPKQTPEPEPEPAAAEQPKRRRSRRRRGRRGGRKGGGGGDSPPNAGPSNSGGGAE